MTLRRAKTSTFWDEPNVATGHTPGRTTLSISGASIRARIFLRDLPVRVHKVVELRQHPSRYYHSANGFQLVAPLLGRVRPPLRNILVSPSSWVAG
jgi:hypothetical protein